MDIEQQRVKNLKTKYKLPKGETVVVRYATSEAVVSYILSRRADGVYVLYELQEGVPVKLETNKNPKNLEDKYLKDFLTYKDPKEEKISKKTKETAEPKKPKTSKK